MAANNGFDFLEKHSEPGHLLDASREGIAIFDENHRLVECNRSFARMLGYTREELLGMPSWSLDADMTEAQIRGAFQDFSAVDSLFESRHRRKDGSVYDVEFSARGTTISGRRLIITVSRDITQRKRERDALLRTQFAMDNTRDTCVWVADDGRIAYANHSACTSLGYTREELLRMKIFDIDPDFPADQF